ncbi:unnamed protein product [Arctogadus glacialis]
MRASNRLPVERDTPTSPDKRRSDALGGAGQIPSLRKTLFSRRNDKDKTQSKRKRDGRKTEEKRVKRKEREKEEEKELEKEKEKRKN